MALSSQETAGSRAIHADRQQEVAQHTPGWARYGRVSGRPVRPVASEPQRSHPVPRTMPPASGSGQRPPPQTGRGRASPAPSPAGGRKGAAPARESRTRASKYARKSERGHGGTGAAPVSQERPENQTKKPPGFRWLPRRSGAG